VLSETDFSKLRLGLKVVKDIEVILRAKQNIFASKGLTWM